MATTPTHPSSITGALVQVPSHALHYPNPFAGLNLTMTGNPVTDAGRASAFLELSLDRIRSFAHELGAMLSYDALFSSEIVSELIMVRESLLKAATNLENDMASLGMTRGSPVLALLELNAVAWNFLDNLVVQRFRRSILSMEPSRNLKDHAIEQSHHPTYITNLPTFPPQVNSARIAIILPTPADVVPGGKLAKYLEELQAKAVASGADASSVSLTTGGLTSTTIVVTEEHTADSVLKQVVHRYLSPTLDHTRFSLKALGKREYVYGHCSFLYFEVVRENVRNGRTTVLELVERFDMREEDKQRIIRLGEECMADFLKRAGLGVNPTTLGRQSTSGSIASRNHRIVTTHEEDELTRQLQPYIFTPTSHTYAQASSENSATGSPIVRPRQKKRHARAQASSDENPQQSSTRDTQRTEESTDQAQNSGNLEAVPAAGCAPAADEPPSLLTNDMSIADPLSNSHQDAPPATPSSTLPDVLSVNPSEEPSPQAAFIIAITPPEKSTGTMDSSDADNTSEHLAPSETPSLVHRPSHVRRGAAVVSPVVDPASVPVFYSDEENDGSTLGNQSAANAHHSTSFRREQFVIQEDEEYPRTHLDDVPSSSASSSEDESTPWTSPAEAMAIAANQTRAMASNSFAKAKESPQQSTRVLRTQSAESPSTSLAFNPDQHVPETSANRVRMPSVKELRLPDTDALLAALPKPTVTTSRATPRGYFRGNDTPMVSSQARATPSEAETKNRSSKPAGQQAAGHSVTTVIWLGPGPAQLCASNEDDLDLRPDQLLLPPTSTMNGARVHGQDSQTVESETSLESEDEEFESADEVPAQDQDQDGELSTRAGPSPQTEAISPPETFATPETKTHGSLAAENLSPFALPKNAGGTHFLQTQAASLLLSPQDGDNVETEQHALGETDLVNSTGAMKTTTEEPRSVTPRWGYEVDLKQYRFPPYLLPRPTQANEFIQTLMNSPRGREITKALHAARREMTAAKERDAEAFRKAARKLASTPTSNPVSPEATENGGAPTSPLNLPSPSRGDTNQVIVYSQHQQQLPEPTSYRSLQAHALTRQNFLMTASGHVATASQIGLSKSLLAPISRVPQTGAPAVLDSNSRIQDLVVEVDPTLNAEPPTLPTQAPIAKSLSEDPPDESTSKLSRLRKLLFPFSYGGSKEKKAVQHHSEPHTRGDIVNQAVRKFSQQLFQSKPQSNLLQNVAPPPAPLGDLEAVFDAMPTSVDVEDLPHCVYRLKVEGVDGICADALPRFGPNITHVYVAAVAVAGDQVCFDTLLTTEDRERTYAPRWSNHLYPPTTRTIRMSNIPREARIIFYLVGRTRTKMPSEYVPPAITTTTSALDSATLGYSPNDSDGDPLRNSGNFNGTSMRLGRSDMNDAGDLGNQFVADGPAPPIIGWGGGGITPYGNSGITSDDGGWGEDVVLAWVAHQLYDSEGRLSQGAYSLPMWSLPVDGDADYVAPSNLAFDDVAGGHGSKKPLSGPNVAKAHVIIADEDLEAAAVKGSPLRGLGSSFYDKSNSGIPKSRRDPDSNQNLLTPFGISQWVGRTFNPEYHTFTFRGCNRPNLISSTAPRLTVRFDTYPFEVTSPKLERFDVSTSLYPDQMAVMATTTTGSTPQVSPVNSSASSFLSFSSATASSTAPSMAPTQLTMANSLFLTYHGCPYTSAALRLQPLHECIDTKSLRKEQKERLERLQQADALTALSTSDRQLIWQLRYSLLNQPRMLRLFLQSIEWRSKPHREEAYRLIERWSRPSRPILMIELLDVSFYNSRVRRYAVSLLRGLSPPELQPYLLQLTQSLKYETDHDSDLARFLIESALASPTQTGHALYWNLRNEFSINITFAERFVLILEAFLTFCPIAAEQLRNQQMVVEKLKRLAKLVRARRDRGGLSDAALLEMYVQEITKLNRDVFARIPGGCFQLPLNPKIEVKGLIPNKCKIMSSKMAPLWLVFENADPKAPPVYVIFKNGDDLRQDVLTLQILRAMDEMWLEDGLDMRLSPYLVVPTGSNPGGRGCGMIEVVLKSCTTAGIQMTFGGGAGGAFKLEPLDKYLQMHNPIEKNYEEAVTNFLYSCAGYCVATYVLGIGDRHNDNIMVTQDGHLFHIDFGHFLGNFKSKYGFKRERSAFVFTPEMAYVIGGKNYESSPRFKLFKELCHKAFLCLRRHALDIELFFTLSTGMPELKTKLDVHYIRRQLCLGQSERDAVQTFSQELKRALSSTSRRIDNYFHILKHAKD